jgi:uncharacterized protein YjiS (DUF1127 family)
MSAQNLNAMLTLDVGTAGRTPLHAGHPSALAKTAGTLRLWARRARQRAQLRGVLDYDAHFFHDIGIPRATLYVEARKWFWQA